MASVPQREEPTYDSPSAFLEAMDYCNNSTMNSEMLQYHQATQFNAFKPGLKNAEPIDPVLSNNQFNSFNLDTNFWNQPSQFTNNLQTINPILSPLDGHQSCDTGYVSQEGSPDKSPVDMASLSYGHDMTVNPSNTVGPKSRKRSSTKTTSSKTSSDSKPSPSRKTRRTSKAMSIDMMMMMDEEDDGKREQFLARNREAASKCRQKKKEWTQNLEQRARELSSQKQMLTTYLAMLKNELLMLKCKCLEHSDCGCDAIRDYLKNTVNRMPPANAALYERLESKDAAAISHEIARKQSMFDHMSPGDVVTSPSTADDDDFMQLEAELSRGKV